MDMKLQEHDLSTHYISRKLNIVEINMKVNTKTHISKFRAHLSIGVIYYYILYILSTYMYIEPGWPNRHNDRLPTERPRNRCSISGRRMRFFSFLIVQIVDGFHTASSPIGVCILCELTCVGGGGSSSSRPKRF